MANIYVDSNATGSGTGADWANAFTTITSATAADAAGDTIYIAHNHAESNGAASPTFALAGTIANPSKVVCVNTGTGAVATTGSIESLNNFSVAVNGSGYVYGLVIKGGSGANSQGISFNYNASGTHVVERCTLEVIATGSSSGINIGSNGGDYQTVVTWLDTTLKMSTGASRLSITGVFRWSGGSYVAGAAQPTALFTINQRGFENAIFEGVDLSAMATGAHLCGSTSGVGIFTFRNCKLPASWSGSLFSGALTAPGLRGRLHNCDSGSTNYRLWEEDYSGYIKNENTFVRSGGYSDGTTQLSWRMTSTANANEHALPLVSPELPAVWNTATGSSKTATVEIIHDSATNLTDAEVWLEIQYLSASGSPLSGFVRDKRASIVATPADQDASTATWTTTGMTNPNKQKLVVSFTPQKAGFIQARVFLAKASKTIYVDPKITVA